MTRQISKLCLLIWLLSNSGCASFDAAALPDGESRVARVYISSPRQKGMARAQAGELVPYEKTKDWLCTTPEDSDALMELLSHSK